MKTNRFLTAPLLGLLLLSGCVKRAPNLAALSPDDLYQQAKTAYDAGNYRRAIEYFSVFADQHLGDPRAPEARLLLGRAYMERDDQVTAVVHLQRLVNDFPSSPLQLDARFGICQAYHELSPKPALDQEYTQSAILHCESVAQYYPGTEQAETATRYVAELRQKLAQKAYDTGMFYLKRKIYDAAALYFEDVVEQFPRTSVAPEALARLVETYTLIGYVEEAQEARERLLRDYPNSPQAQAVRAE